MKHTKEPWIYSEDDGTVRSDNRGKQQNIVAEMGVSGVRLARVDHANGYLAAAAPELYESLKALIRDIDVWEESVERIIGRQPDAGWGQLTEARTAIARAEGRDS